MPFIAFSTQCLARDRLDIVRLHPLQHVVEQDNKRGSLLLVSASANGRARTPTWPQPGPTQPAAKLVPTSKATPICVIFIEPPCFELETEPTRGHQPISTTPGCGSCRISYIAGHVNATCRRGAVSRGQ